MKADYTKKLVLCSECDKPIKDERLIALTSLAQVFDTHSTDSGCCGDLTPLEVGWTKRNSLYFHEKCLELMSGPEFIKRVSDPEINERWISQMRKLAGIEEE